jgi:hypothetical protein
MILLLIIGIAAVIYSNCMTFMHSFVTCVRIFPKVQMMKFFVFNEEKRLEKRMKLREIKAVTYVMDFRGGLLRIR